MNTALLDRRIAQLARRRRLQRLLDGLWPSLAVALGLAAVAVVVIRIAAAELAPWLGVMIGGLAGLGLLVGLWRGRSRAEPRGALAGRLDSLMDARGLAMALAEQPAEGRDEDWLVRLRVPLESFRAPRLTARHLPWALLAAVAVVAALWIPQRVPETPPVVAPWQQHFEAAKANLEQLAGAGAIAPVEKQRLEQQLERLQELASQGGMSQGTWEALDRVDRALHEARQLAARRLAEAMVATQTADTPREGDPPVTETPEEREARGPDGEKKPRDRDRLNRPKPEQPGGEGVDPDSDRRLLKQLTRERERERLSRLAESLGRLAQAAPGLLGRESLSPKAREALEKLLEKAAEQGLLDEAAKQALEQAGLGGQEGGEPQPGGAGGGELDEASTRKMLEELEKALEEGRVKLGQLGMGGDLDRLMVALRAAATAAGPGTGRGGGRAKLTRDDRAGVEAAGGTESLPEGARRNADGSITVATQKREVELDPAVEEALVRAQLKAHGSADADARRARIAPRHRAAVGRYFGTGGTPPGGTP